MPQTWWEKFCLWEMMNIQITACMKCHSTLVKQSLKQNSSSAMLGLVHSSKCFSSKQQQKKYIYINLFFPIYIKEDTQANTISSLKSLFSKASVQCNLHSLS